MQTQQHRTSRIIATVTEVLPSVGLAYVVAEDSSTWAVTKSTKSTNDSGFPTLTGGRRVQLTVTHHPNFSLVSAYSVVD